MEMIFKKKLFFFVVISLFFLAGCGGSEKGTNPYNFPDYVFTSHHSGSVTAYEYTVTAEDDILDYIPCYCSCFVDPFNHNSVKDCFISNEQSTNEATVFDPHGANCGICIETVLDVKKLKEQNIGNGEIRDYIDREYSKFAEPTPTPHPDGH